MLSTSQTYLGAPLKTSVFDFSTLTFFKKNYFYNMSHRPYCVTISSTIHSSQSSLQAPITFH